MALPVSASLLSKFRGCLIGSHVGDCLGGPFEGDYPVSKAVLSKFMTTYLNGMTKGNAAQMLPYSDDTAMTLNLGKSLVEKKSFHPLDMSKRFVDEYVKNPRRGYGAHVVEVFRALDESNFEDVFGPAKRQFGGSGSYGNGAAMRIAPAALYSYDKINEMLQIAKSSALITHANQNGYNGAILQCLAVDQALRTSSTATIDPIFFINNLIKQMESIEQVITNSKSLEGEKPICNQLKKMKDIFCGDFMAKSPDAIADMLGNYVTARESVPTAIYSFLRGLHPLESYQCDNPFVRTMFFAIAVGGDTDTIAAMAGAISGAYHGEEGIPKSVKEKCESIDESKLLADDLYASCCGN